MRAGEGRGPAPPRPAPSSASPPAPLTPRVRAQAAALGFDRVGIAAADPPAGSARIAEWVERGFHAGMAWMARSPEGRGDPRRILPGARSVVVLARSYAAADPPAPAPGVGRVARYARGRDYHRALRRPLGDLARFIESLGPWCARPAVDAAPLAEKPIAQGAGLGWTGKHTSLVSRSLGTWFFLAEVVTDAPLDPDPPEPDRCGTCSRCLAACPTGAIPAPYLLDARRCIAYWTIEHRGAIPEALRPGIGDHLFGCDDCLAVCPWNRFARDSREARRDLARVDARALVVSSEARIRERFSGTPLLRARPEGLRRNAAVVLGNTAGGEALPPLARARRGDPDPVVREASSWAIARIEGRRRRAEA